MNTPSPILRALALPSALLLLSLPISGRADAPAIPQEPPASWIDPDTGHRVILLTREPGSASFYFNDNGYTPDGKEMVYTTPAGISVLNLATLQARQVVPAPAKSISVGRKTPTIYYLKATDDPLFSTLWSTNVDTGETRKIADLPRRGGIFTINADETLAAGTYIEGDGADYGGPGTMQTHILDQPVNKPQMMADRLAARLPIDMYTVDLANGKSTILLHSTDWLNHLQFSPTDPTLLMYCHEGAWHQVDRIWTIRTDGSQNQLIHKRTMEMEIAGHEWWGLDGKTVWYQLSLPRGVPSSEFLAGYNVETGERIWYHYDHDAASIHHNISPDGTVFCGDGNHGNPWIILCHPVRIADDHTLGSNLIKGGYFKVERLVNMARQNYRLEPNPSFTPDQKWVVFRANMYGATYSFAVEVAKAGSP